MMGVVQSGWTECSRSRHLTMHQISTRTPPNKAPSQSPRIAKPASIRQLPGLLIPACWIFISVMVYHIRQRGSAVLTLISMIGWLGLDHSASEFIAHDKPCQGPEADILPWSTIFSSLSTFSALQSLSCSDLQTFKKLKLLK